MNILLKMCIIIAGVGIAANSQSEFSLSNNGLTLHLNPVNEIYEEGYLKLVKERQSSTQNIGLPELPIYSTLYMVDPNKDYNFEIIVNERLVIINKVAIIAVDLVKKVPTDLEETKLS